MKKKKNGKGKRNKGKLDSGADDSSKTELDDLKREKEQKSGGGETEDIDIVKILDDIILHLRKVVGEESETRNTEDYQERKEKSYEESGEISYLEATCSKCGNDFSEGYTTYIGNEKSYELISLVQLCPECWPEYEKLIREINLYGIDKDDGKCFECGRPAYLSFRIVHEKLEIEEPFTEEFFGDEMGLLITDDFCFIPFCGDCMQKFLLRMKSHFLKFTKEEIYYQVIGFCKSLK
jgi:hypothetical protein